MANDTKKPLSPVEIIKENSNYLRGTIEDSLKNPLTGSISPDDTQLVKFHGFYQQSSREFDSERKKQKLEPLYSFMIRVRVPGGLSTPKQWLEMDRLADIYANGTLKLTTRQAYQFHGVLKRNLKKHIAEINNAMLDTIAACGDVNRNVMCSPNPAISELHEDVFKFSQQISEHLTPATKAYYELWLEDELVAGGPRKEDNEPIYGKTYLPRKFKIAIAVPPDNDTDIFTNDVGLIAIADKNQKLAGFNLAIGGGMGNTLEDDRTYPRLGNVIGYYNKKDIVKVIEDVLKIQRDHGNREDRKIARLKYTIDRLGLDWFVKELEKRSGIKPEKNKNFHFNSTSDRYGWTKSHKEDMWHYTLFVEHGRVKDTDLHKTKTALREIAVTHRGDFRLTGNQNLVIGNVSTKEKENIERILKKHNSLNSQISSPLRLNSLACVALNTCPLANSAAETYLPSLIDKIEPLLIENNIQNEAITIRMTGCPNGCARPYNAEIGLVGRAPSIYNLYIGGSHQGIRLNTLYKEMLKEEQILEELSILFNSYAKNRKEGEHFGDFTVRFKIVVPELYINAL